MTCFNIMFLLNIDPVNKLYLFDWIIFISAEYVVYIMCVIFVTCTISYVQCVCFLLILS